MAESPTQTYAAWFEALPPAIAEELAQSLIAVAPEGILRSVLVTGNVSAGFAARVRRMASTAELDVGTALTLAALTDFVFLENTDPAHWERSEAMIDLLDEAQRAAGMVQEELSPFLEQARLRGPLRARQWSKELEAWRALREGALEPAQIAGFLRDARVAALKPPRS